MSERFKAIIVDDELSARNILSKLLGNFCPEIDVVSSCEDLEQAVVSIKLLKPDLVFLDIEMPNYAGYEITRFFDEIDFEIIFITAYDHYAIKAFEVSALDYLLKPIEIDRLKEAVKKFLSKNRNKDLAINYQVLIESINENKVNKIIVPHQGDQKVILVDDIIVIKANESYSQIYTLDSNKYLMSKNLKHFENLFSNNSGFIRTHKSWLINTKYLKLFSF